MQKCENPLVVCDRPKRIRINLSQRVSEIRIRPDRPCPEKLNRKRYSLVRSLDIGNKDDN